MGVFVENKIVLKVMICALYTVIQAAGTDSHLPIVQPIIQDNYYQLYAMSKLDAQLNCDDTPYGVAISRQWTVPFNTACNWLSERGIHLMTADLGTNVRRVQSRIYSYRGQQYCLVFATSALAEGVNLAGLRTVIITSAQTGETIWLSHTKVLQMLGRVDREDLGGIAYIPSPGTLRSVQQPLSGAALTVDLLGRGVTSAQYDDLSVIAGHDAFLRGSRLFTERDMHTVLGSERLVEILYPRLKHYRVGGAVPFYTNGTVRELPAILRLKKENCVLTTMAKLVRFLATDEWFPLHVFTFDDVIVGMLSNLPPAAAILIVLVVSRKSNTATQPEVKLARAKRLRQFTKAQQVLLGNGPESRQFWASIHNVITAIHKQAMRPTAKDVKCAGYSVGIHEASADEILAQSVYVTASLHCVHDWERVSGEWATYSDTFRGMPMLFDYVVGALLENPQLPYMRAQRHFFRFNPIPQLRVTGIINDFYSPELLYDAMYHPASDHLYGYEIRPQPASVSTGDAPHLVPGCVIENHVLILLVVVAKRIDKFLRTEAEIGFGQARRALADASDRAYGERIDLVQLGGRFTTRPEAPLMPSVAKGEPEPEPNTIYRGVDRYMAIDAWGRIPVTAYDKWDSRVDRQRATIEDETRIVRQKFEEASRTRVDDRRDAGPGDAQPEPPNGPGPDPPQEPTADKSPDDRLNLLLKQQTDINHCWEAVSVLSICECWLFYHRPPDGPGDFKYWPVDADYEVYLQWMSGVARDIDGIYIVLLAIYRKRRDYAVLAAWAPHIDVALTWIRELKRRGDSEAIGYCEKMLRNAAHVINA
jgi:hypothetical protein